jgi:hypothetical protein
VEGAEAVPADRAAAELAAQGIQANQFEEWIMSTQVTAKPVAIQDFAAGLRKLPASAFDRTDEVTDFLRSAPIFPDTLAPYLMWDDQHYTRNLIDKTRLYELIAICWEVGQISSVHNHRDQNCWMAVPIGRLLVQNYHMISQDLRSGKCKLEATDTVEMNAAHPCRLIPGIRCIACLILASLTREPSACTSIRGPLIPAWSIRQRKARAAKSSCTTRQNTGSQRTAISV